MESRKLNMGTTKEDIKEWLETATAQKASHLIVVCDTFSYEDYPIYARDKNDCIQQVDDHNGKNMQKVMEVYNMSMDLKKQIAEHRAMNI